MTWLFALLFAATAEFPQVEIPMPPAPGQVQAAPAIASDGFESVIGYTQDSHVVIAHLTSDGYPDRAADLGDGLSPKIAFDGVEYLAVWFTSDSVVAQRIPRDGTPGERFLIAPVATTSVAVAAAESQFVVAWSGPAGAIARVTNNNLTTTIAALPQSRSSIDIASRPSRAFVVWAEADGNVTTIRGASVDDLDKRVVIASETRGVPAGKEGNWEVSQPHVACGDGTCVVTWVRANLSAMGSTAFAARLTADDLTSRVFAVNGVGPISGPLDVSAFPFFDGARFRVLVRSYSDFVAREILLLDDAAGPSLPLAVPGPLWSSDQPSDLTAVAFTPSRHIVAYSRFVHEDSTRRVFVRVIDDAAGRRRGVRAH